MYDAHGRGTQRGHRSCDNEHAIAVEVTRGYEGYVRVRDSDCEGQVPRQRRRARRQAVLQGHGRHEAEKNEIWNAIKTIPTGRRTSSADIQVTADPAPRRRHLGAPPAAKTYTVKAGDTLGGIAKEHLGSAGAYMKIFEANKDQLTDPDKIRARTGPAASLALPRARQRS